MTTFWTSEQVPHGCQFLSGEHARAWHLHPPAAEQRTPPEVPIFLLEEEEFDLL